MYFYLIVGTKILIAGGRSPYSSSAYVLRILFDKDDNEVITKVEHSTINDMPFNADYPFYLNVQGRLIVGGGNKKRKVAALDSLNWVDLPPLNFNRYDASSFYINGTLFVAGGLDHSQGNYLDSIERLKINSNDTEERWETCKETLPYKVIGHTTVIFNDNIYLIGGLVECLGATNKIWKGTIDDRNEITFKEVPPMQNKRYYHFSFSYSNKIYIFGGEEDNGKVEIFDGQGFIQGPQFSFYLSRFNGDNAILNMNGIIIITIRGKPQEGKTKEGIIIYNPLTGKITHYPEFKLKDKDRLRFAALLI